jgi:serine/threonine protein kinase
MEYANSGNLANQIFTTKRGSSRLIPRFLSDEMLLSFFLDCVLGLHHLHTLGILHRDIKLENLLIHDFSSSFSLLSRSVGVPQRDLHVLIADFGQCEDLLFPSSSSNGTFISLPPILFAYPLVGSNI